FARICTGPQTATGFADVRAILGYDIFNDEDYHFGVGALVAIPTGNKPNARYIFEPIVGNGQHWEIGAHITGHVILWRSDDEESNIGLFTEANVTHMFETSQQRTFDIKNKPL